MAIGAFKLIYYDIRYPTSWIDKEASKRIREYFVNKGFKDVDASELAKAIDEAVKARRAANTVVIFAQDVALATIVYGPFSDALIRRYLDLGGRVVWMGDTPFYYQGHFDEKIEEWGSIGEQEVLGVFTYPTWPLLVGVTPDGLRWGLKLKWAGYRPVALRAAI